VISDMNDTRRNVGVSLQISKHRHVRSLDDNLANRDVFENTFTFLTQTRITVLK